MNVADVPIPVADPEDADPAKVVTFGTVVVTLSTVWRDKATTAACVDAKPAESPSAPHSMTPALELVDAAQCTHAPAEKAVFPPAGRLAGAEVPGTVI